MSHTDFRLVKAKDIHPSSVLPEKKHDNVLTESVKSIGVQQPLIVRPLPSKPGQYEVDDGLGRLNALDPEQEVVVDVRENATDAEVFKISEATQKRNQRTTVENAEFYAAYVATVAKETGERGAIARVAKESNTSESHVSQCLAINNLFTKLSHLEPEFDFTELWKMGMNKLYELSKLAESPKLLQVAQEIEARADSITVEGISELVRSALGEQTVDEFLKEIGMDDTSGGAASVPDTVRMPSESPNVLETRFKTLSQKISKQMQKLNSILPQIEIESFAQKASTSPKTLEILEKVSTNVRRLLFYLKKLEHIEDG
jgi:ParB/RepB/Spo0J family partition protein